MNALARAEGEIVAEHRHIAAITPDRQRFTAWLKADTKAPFPVLTDIDSGYAMSLHLAIWVGDEMKEIMTSPGWDPSVSRVPSLYHISAIATNRPWLAAGHGTFAAAPPENKVWYPNFTDGNRGSGNDTLKGLGGDDMLLAVMATTRSAAGSGNDYLDERPSVTAPGD